MTLGCPGLSCSTFHTLMVTALAVAAGFASPVHGQVSRSQAQQIQAQDSRVLAAQDLRRGNTFPMPDVVGLTIPQAEQRVMQAGQSVGARSAQANIIERRTDNRPEGVIIQQREATGQAMRPYLDDVGGVYGQVTFNVVISTGPPAPVTFAMPNVVGLTVPEAERRVMQAGRMVRTRSARAVVEAVDHERSAGTIVGQRQAPGTTMRPYLNEVGGTYGEVTFDVFVSNGPQPAPDFLGMRVEDARRDANRREVTLGLSEPLKNATQPAGVIIRQDPAPGRPMSGRRVTVWPSAGYPLPNYVQRRFRDARDEAEKLGFVLNARSANNLDVPEGVIIEQRPAPGTLLPLQEPVTVLVSRGWPVPDLTGRIVARAEATAAEIRARLVRAEQDSVDVTPGVILAQRPLAGELLPANREINVTVSRGYPLPDLVGQSEEAAFQLATRLKFRLEVGRAPIAGRAVNLVDRQNPAAGTRLPLTEPVRIVVSDGWPTPDFLTLTEAAAQALAGDRQVTVTVTERRQDRASQAGVVIAQTPSPGSLLPPGQTVGLVLSAGYPTPKLVDLPEDEAHALAGREGFVLDSTMTASAEYAMGIVSAQVPAPGSLLPADNRVAITVSSGWPTPEFIGLTEDAARRLAADNRVTLVQGTPREHYEWASGLVFGQQPAAGDTLPANRSVSVSFSLGWPVAPRALGEAAESVAESFTAQHPNAMVVLEERFLTLEPVGSVIAQHPDADLKLGPEQRLELVVSAVKPPWAWAALGLFLVAGAATAIAKIRANGTPPDPDPHGWAQDAAGIQLRVGKDHGAQTISGADGESPETAAAGDAVQIRVIGDLGTQTATPLDEKGGET